MSVLFFLAIAMNQGKHTNLGLGILIGGLAAALLFRQSPTENDSLPELEQTKVLERDFSLDFAEDPILVSEIDEFEALHPLEFNQQPLPPSGAKLQGIEVATTPERAFPIPGSFQDRAPISAIEVPPADPLATVTGSEPLMGIQRKMSNPSSLPEGISVPAQPVKAEISATDGFPLPADMFSESFLQENPESGKHQSLSTSGVSISREHQVSHPGPESVLPEPSEVVPAKPPAARVIIPRRVRLGEPVSRQLGMGTNSLQDSLKPRSIRVNSTSTGVLKSEARQRIPSTDGSTHRDTFPSLEGLEPLSDLGN